MNDKTKNTVLTTLCDWITFLLSCLPIRSCGTFIELLMGSLLSGSGFVTETYLSIGLKRKWFSYHKWLESGKWSYLALSKKLTEWFLGWSKKWEIYFVLDDTVCYRASQKAPGSLIHHQHGHKVNRPEYVLGQNWLTLAGVLVDGTRRCAIPLLSRLMPGNGQSSKLKGACVLLRALRGLIQQGLLLMDSWFMKRKLIEAVLQQGLQVIGQVRRDSVFYEPIAPSVLSGKKRGRPRKYGKKLTNEVVQSLPTEEKELFLYGKQQKVVYRQSRANARFLNGREVKVLWCQFVTPEGLLTQQRVIVSTDTTLTAEDILTKYSHRWQIEPMFCEWKNTFGVKETWQQTRRTLQRWIQILSVGYAFARVLAFLFDQTESAKAFLTPWRSQQTLTAGQVRIGLRSIFSNVMIRNGWDPKYRKFQLPIQHPEHRYLQTFEKAA